jgi:hypothetical protein
MRAAIIGVFISATIWVAALAGYATIIICSLFVASFYFYANARAADKLLISKLEGQQRGKEVVRVVWQDSNAAALVTSTNIKGPQTPLLYRVDTNQINFVVTVLLPTEKDHGYLRLVPKFTGAIPEKK